MHGVKAVDPDELLTLLLVLDTEDDELLTLLLVLDTEDDELLTLLLVLDTEDDELLTLLLVFDIEDDELLLPTSLDGVFMALPPEQAVICEATITIHKYPKIDRESYVRIKFIYLNGILITTIAKRTCIPHIYVSL